MQHCLVILFCAAAMLFRAEGVYAQEEESLFDLMEEIEGEDSVEVDGKPPLIGGTFGGTHIINGESIETVPKRTWSFIISHRFGTLNSGWRDFFGLDAASIRFAMEYGILDNLTVGAGRSTFEKTYDFYVKYRFLEQRESGMPLSIAYYGNVSFNTLKPIDEDLNFFSNRVAYANQLLIARKFNDWFSFQLTPTMVHQNLVLTPQDPNTLFLIGLGAKVKMHKMMSLVVEYYPSIKSNRDGPYRDAVAIGLDLVTGGHVFQFQFTNANAMYTQGFTRKTTGDFFKGDVHFGFNISRTFGMSGKIKEKRAAKKEAM